MAKRETNNGKEPTKGTAIVPTIEEDFKDEFFERSMEWCAVLCTNDFADSENDDPQPILALQGEAERDIKELTQRIHRCCTDGKWTAYQKRVACEQLVKLAVLSTGSLNRLLREFPEPFREIAEEMPYFPSLFPTSRDKLLSLQKTIWDELNLGKRHPLKLRAAPGRKTFSTKTWTNKLLTYLIEDVHKRADEQRELDPGEKRVFEPDCRDVAYHVPLTLKNAKEWLAIMWKVLLVAIPNPETHPRLRQLVERPSLRRKRMRRDGTVGEKTQAHNVRAAIKAKLGVYLKRMLSGSAVHK